MKTKQTTNAMKVLTSVFVISILFLLPAPAHAAESERVTVDNFVRAESDNMIRANMKGFNLGFDKFTHLRKPTTPDNQPTIRMNQDTLYSSMALDLSNPVKITLPEVGGRYMSMLVVSQDHYIWKPTIWAGTASTTLPPNPTKTARLRSTSAVIPKV